MILNALLNVNQHAILSYTQYMLDQYTSYIIHMLLNAKRQALLLYNIQKSIVSNLIFNVDELIKNICLICSHDATYGILYTCNLLMLHIIILVFNLFRLRLSTLL